MPTDAHAITEFDWPTFGRLMADYRAGRLGGKPLTEKNFQPAGRPNIRCILLEDLESGDDAESAVMDYQAVDEIQQVSFMGTITGGTWRLVFSGEQTADLEADASALEVKEALEALAGFGPGDVQVTAYEARYLVRFTGQYAGDNVPLMTSVNSLTGAYNAIRITSVFRWIDSGRTEAIHCQVPVGSPTPLVAGVVVSAGWFPAAGKYGILNVECRDLSYDVDEY